MRLDKNKFIARLKSKPSAEIVGENRDCHSCPIANFYFQASGGCEIAIFQNDWGGYVIDRGYSKRPMPQWVERFISEVDGDDDGRISARRALEVMSTY